MDEVTVESRSEALRAAVGEFVRAARRHETMGANPMAALGHLDRVGPSTIARLAEAAHVRHQSMAKLVEQLGDAGALTTEPHPQDRRSVLVTITDSGRAVLTAERTHRSAWIAAAMQAELTPDEQSHLARSADLLLRLARYDG